MRVPYGIIMKKNLLEEASCDIYRQQQHHRTHCQHHEKKKNPRKSLSPPLSLCYFLYACYC
jgi:hypothetical protein